MKRYLLLALVVLGCVALEAGQPQRTGLSVSAKVILKSKQGYFVLSDGTSWKVIGFEKRWRSLSEWWNSVQLVPENYECMPNDWYLGASIDVYPKYGNLEVSEANASNQEDLKKCTHLLINTNTGQVLFAVGLDPATCLVQVFKDAYDDGYRVGYDAGKLSSYKNATEVYNDGHTDGYKEGYTEGYKDATKGARPNS